MRQREFALQVVVGRIGFGDLLLQRDGLLIKLHSLTWIILRRHTGEIVVGGGQSLLIEMRFRLCSQQTRPLIDRLLKCAFG